MDIVNLLISKGKVKQALELLAKLYPEEGNNWLSLQARWNGLQNDIRRGIITSQNANIQRNQITHATLEFAKDAAESYGDRLKDKGGTRGILSVEKEVASIEEEYPDELMEETEEESTVIEESKPTEKAPKIKENGQLFYRIPTQMQVQKMTTCTIRIAYDKKTLTRDLTLTRGDKITTLKRLTDDMSVKLIDPSGGQNFTIKSYSDEIQFVEKDDYSEWNFYVTPTKKGAYPLLLQVSVIQIVRGKERKRHITENIEVEILATAPTNAERKDFIKGTEPIKIREEIPNGKIYFSYAWGDSGEEGESREKIVDELYESLKADGYEVNRDKQDNHFGDSIGQFMDDLGDGDLVLVFTSEKYFKSAYCMYELNELGSRFEYKPNQLRKAILPIPVEFINFKKRDTLAKYKRFWKKEEEGWAAHVEEFKDSMSVWEWKEYQFAKELNGVYFSKLIGVLIDINQSTTKLLSKNDFALVKDTIKKRLISSSTIA